LSIKGATNVVEYTSIARGSDAKLEKKVLYKYVTYVLVLAMLITLMVPASVSANAAPGSNIGIMVDGRNVNLDVAPFTDAQNRTMVPISFIRDELGAQVDWAPLEQRVTIRYQGQEIVLWIGSRDAWVNGNTVTMDTQAILVDQRTMVPVRFIGGHFGIDVDWQPANRMVVITTTTTDIGADQSQGNIAVVTTDNINVRSGPGTGFSVVGQVFQGDEFRIISSASDNERRLWHEVTLNNGSVGWIAGWLVTLSDDNSPSQGDSPGLTGDERRVAIVTGSVVNLRRGPGTSYDILSTTRSGDMLEVVNESTGWHYVRTVNGTQGWISGQHVSIQTIRDDRRSHQTASRGAGRVVSFNNNLGFPDSALIGLEYEEQDEAFFITLTGNRGMSYSIMYLDNPYRIVIDVQGVTVDLPQEAENIPLNNNFVNRIRVSQFSEDVGRIVLELREPIVIRELSRQGDSELTFLFQRTSIVGKLIVIDPGHGTIRDTGRPDPGVVGQTGLTEKETVMDIANRLADILREKGAEVALTRTGPTNMNLQERAPFANALGADLFVSIHTDGNVNRDIGGTTTFFYAPADNPMLGPQRFQRARLAHLVQDSMVAHGGRQDRGVQQRRYVVLRYTNMPSILVETAFMSNPTEEQLLADPEFRQRIARGIAEGIERYFN